MSYDYRNKSASSKSLPDMLKETAKKWAEDFGKELVAGIPKSYKAEKSRVDVNDRCFVMIEMKGQNKADIDCTISVAFMIDVWGGMIHGEIEYSDAMRRNQKVDLNMKFSDDNGDHMKRMVDAMILHV